MGTVTSNLALASQERGELLLVTNSLAGLSVDCNANGTPDECELATRDCQRERRSGRL